MTKYGRSFWVDRFPKSRVPSYPRFRGELVTDVAIIGGGLTGCATAYAFAASGMKVALVEAGQIGRGGTGSGTGWIGDDPGVGFANLETALGLRTARRAWQAWHRAGLDFAALIRRLNVRCSLELSDGLTVALGLDQAVHLKRERKTRVAAGLDAAMLKPRVVAKEAGLAAAAAIRAREGATLDPYRASLGLASAARDRGAELFERSPVTKIRFDRKRVDVHTAAGTIRPARVIVATGAPTALFSALRRHFSYQRTYLALTAPVPAKTRHRLGERDIVLRDSARPPHIVRWVDDERLLVTGADSEAAGDRQREKVIVQRTGQLMYELSTLYPDISGIPPDYGWDAGYARTGDGLPFIGPHRNYPYHLFAFGDASHNVTGAYLASRILLRHFLDETEPADEAYGFRLVERSG